MEKEKRQYDEHDLFSFASCGTKENLDNMINYLSQLAEEENWTVKEGHPNGVLRYYIFYTFRQCHIQKRLLYSSDHKWCCINTGLLDNHGNDILMIFEENKSKGVEGVKDWYFKFFKTRVDREYMDHFSSIPSLPSYTNNYEDFYFDPEKTIEVNYEHILDDNWERISTVVNIDKQIMEMLLVGVIDNSKKRVKRNVRLVVPQLYNNQIMYLMPIYIPVGNDQYVTMALAIEKTATNQYRANTIFTKDDAYQKARLLMKPESNWLIDD